ncbi:hypothetical protein BDV97DRAFT_410426 [Delphinella strobiligena]|nr:hypothetical protein BDV97DRAFT_410426 [Delphinella strobiligena]
MILYGLSQIRRVTAADNPEWLDLFKKAHSFAIIPDSPEAEAKNIPDDLEIYQDLGMRLPSSLRKQPHTETALVSMFLTDHPQAKNYPRFSSLPVCPQKALRFETIAGPWPDAGILGETIITRDWIFSLTIHKQLAIPRLHTAAGPLQEEIQAESTWLSLEAASDVDWSFSGPEQMSCGDDGILGHSSD